MRAEKLDARVTLERSSRDTDDLGGITETWQTLATVWSGVRFLKGRELVEAQQISGEAQCVFMIRYSEQVKVLDVDDRITYQSAKYAIVAPPIPLPAGRPEFLQIFTKSIK